MRPVLQNRFGNMSTPVQDRGNCIQAAVASLFECALDDVPNFIAAPDWFQALKDWLWPSGLVPILSPVGGIVVPSGTLYLLIGTSPRSHEWTHIAVYKDGRLLHDPHPSQDGLADGEKWVVLFVARDPAFSSP